MELPAFLRELKRRQVFHVAAVYAVVAFVLVQVTDLLVPALLLPEWTLRLVVFLLLILFPVALILAWAFDLTPDGVRRTETRSTEPASADPGSSAEARSGEGTAQRSAPESGAPSGSGRRGPNPVSGRRRWTFYGATTALLGVGLVLAWLGSGSEVSPPVPGAPGEAEQAVAPAADVDRTEAPGVLSREAPAIAVLPFVNMSPDPDQEFFSDGITEDLLTSLSRIRGMRVISRTSVMRYKGTELPVTEIARELGVSYVLEGSVRREASEVRVTAQLIDALDDTHLWAETYDRELTGIFQIQSEIAQRIADALEQRLSPGDRMRIAEGGTENLTAYELFLRGREYLNRPGEADIRKYPLAMGFFRQALEVDPEYARGYAGLAEAYRRHVLLPVIPVRRDSILFYAGRAVELDPRLAEGVTELGFGHLFAQETAAAEAEFRRALDLDPNQADAAAGLSRLAGVQGRLDEAIRWQRQAVEVDPFSARHLTALGQLLLDVGALQGAKGVLEKAVSLSPDDPVPGFLLAQIHLIEGEEERADDVMEALLALASDHPGALTAMGRVQKWMGRFEEAEEYMARTSLSEFGPMALSRAFILRQLGEDARAEELVTGVREMLGGWERDGYSTPPRGRLYPRVLAGDREGALDILRREWRTGLRWVVDAPYVGVYWIDRDPILAELREDPRFQALVTELRAELDLLREELEFAGVD